MTIKELQKRIELVDGRINESEFEYGELHHFAKLLLDVVKQLTEIVAEHGHDINHKCVVPAPKGIEALPFPTVLIQEFHEN